MTGCDDAEYAAIDDYIRTQLARAAEAYAMQADVDARLEAVLKAEQAED